VRGVDDPDGVAAVAAADLAGADEERAPPPLVQAASSKKTATSGHDRIPEYVGSAYGGSVT
jgi:hypothetical protein